MWDNAASTARSIVTGQYYSVKNVRMRQTPGGYLEGKLVEAKIDKLEEEEAAHNPFLKSLLQSVFLSFLPPPFFLQSAIRRRRADWLKSNNQEIPNEFEYRTIGEAAQGEHFNCVAEVQ